MTVNQQLTPAQKLIKARNKLLLREPFFGVLALKLDVVEDRRPGTTCWTDGKRLGYGPEFINTITEAELRGVVAHEVMHCVYKHQTRRGERNPQKWNMAADYVINPELIDAGFELPEGGLLDDQYRNMSTDHVYNLLPDPPEGDDLGWGEIRDGDFKSSSQRTEQEHDWTVAARQAADAAKKAGNLPSGLERLIDNILESKVPWREVLRNFMTQPRKDDYTMARPNRRFISSGLYLPAMWSEGLGDVVVTVDTSGSITSKELAEFQSEINCIIEDTRPQKVYVLYCDTEVHKDVDEFTPDDYPIQLTPRGGGGTDFTEPFNWVLDNDIQPDAFVYLTDLYGSCLADEPEYPVLWVSTTDKDDVAFGEVIKMT
jgi:predicted metal-dependent peptidase